MTRILLLALLALVALVAVWRFVAAIVEGAEGSPRRRQGVSMVRDPVCGAFVVQSRALTARVDGQLEYFCSDECRKAAERDGLKRGGN